MFQLLLLAAGGGMGAIIGIPSLRRKVLTPSILKWFRSVVPPVSPTERIALESGAPGFERELFAGQIDWESLAQEQWWPQLTEEEQAFLDGPTEQLCNMIDPWEISRTQDLPAEAWQFLKDEGFFGLIIPRQYGGKEMSAFGHSAVIKKVATRDPSAAVTVMVPNSLGPAEILMHYGTERQKDYYLPRLARGEEIPCFALTEPTAGSDASSLRAYGTVEERNGVLGIRLNWDKRYITLAPVATLIGLAFRLYDPEHLLSDVEDRGITCALIPRDTEGMEIGARHNPLDVGFMNGPIRGHEVFVPLTQVIGEADGVGRGWEMLMECLGVGRAISLPTLSVGSCLFASRVVGAYARIRQQFGLPIGKFEGVRGPLAQIAGYTYMLDAASRLTLGRIDQGEQSPVLSAVLKYSLTERMRVAINHGMDILGGAAIQLGPRNLLARAYYALPVAITVEGANILTRNLIVFGQGAFKSHPYIYSEIKAAGDADAANGLNDFDDAFWSHVGLTTSNGLKAFASHLGVGVSVPEEMSEGTEKYYRAIAQFTRDFTVLADTAFVTLGGGLKRREMISGRFADILIALYIGVATLRRYEVNKDIPLAERREEYALFAWAMEALLQEVAEAFDGILRNFPVPLVGPGMRAFLFPVGLNWNGPSDELSNEVAEVLLKSGAARDALTDGMFIPEGVESAFARLESTLLLVEQVEPIAKKVKAYQKRAGQKGKPFTLSQLIAAEVITADEAALYEEAVAARLDIIQVDEFKQMPIPADLTEAGEVGIPRAGG